MDSRTTIRLTISNPRYGFFDKSICTDAASRVEEREFIRCAVYDLLGMADRWMEDICPSEITDPILQIINQFSIAQMKTRMNKGKKNDKRRKA